MSRASAAPDTEDVEGRNDQVGAGSVDSLPVPARPADYATSPHCSPAACALANLATADVLARARVSWASRDVSDAMVSTGLLERVTKAIGQPVGPDQWIAFYRRRAAELAEKLDARHREMRAGVE